MPKSRRSARGSNSAQLRRYNERIVLQILRRLQQASKAELARAAQLTNAAIGAIIQSLHEDGLVEDLGKHHDGGRGQPATLLKLAPRGAFGFGVRIDRTNLETVLVDFEGRVIGRRSHEMILPAPEKALEIVRRDLENLRGLLSQDELARLTGIGLAQPFNLGAWLHELGLPEANFPLWDDFDLASKLEEVMGLPVFHENDGTAATVAELFYGLGRQHDNFLYFFLGPAIGGGLCMNGDVVRGVTGNAGDVAMMPVGPSRLSTAPRPRKSHDILLTRASLVAFARHLEPGEFPGISRLDLQTAVDNDHPRFNEWVEDCVDALTPALGAATALLDVPLVVIDSDLDGRFCEEITNNLSRALAAAAPEARNAPDIKFGTFGQDAGAIGAASLPMFFNFSPRASILTGEASDRTPGSQQSQVENR
ncbi:ROK family transcriptional regulator [Roseibium sp.]|uniref:ROK family transcriptional regulator n=1 Tax=Roseibium sp. TaxID=1936156 RepID=UPI003A976F86